jgi:DNA polymerase V
MTELNIPLFSTLIQAGFPSPADDFIEQKLDLNTYLIDHPAATFFVKSIGQSMILDGIFPGDILIVDKSRNAQSGNIVVASLNGDFTVKRFQKSTKGAILKPSNPDFKDIFVGDGDDFQIWGVVTYVIHSTG